MVNTLGKRSDRSPEFVTACRIEGEDAGALFKPGRQKPDASPETLTLAYSGTGTVGRNSAGSAGTQPGEPPSRGHTELADMRADEGAFDRLLVIHSRRSARFKMLIRRFSLLCVVLLALGRRAATLW